MTAVASILPVILCGGSGTRLWPLSRTHYPKQFLDRTRRSWLPDARNRPVSRRSIAAMAGRLMKQALQFDFEWLASGPLDSSARAGLAALSIACARKSARLIA
ncbi:MAG: sugar phosphate nucleotidyltransferase [Rhodocyclaceae bacterium]|nr:sugar phosphate nucleotidyltransferase [Rhodocyclaceae bacterium]